MSGFENDVMVAKNVNFNNAGAKPHLGIINAAGLLPIGTGNTSPTPEILAGSLTSPLGTLTIGYSSPNITIDVSGGSSAVEHLTCDTGGQLNPTANNFNIFSTVNPSGSTPIQVAGSGSTLSINVQRSQALAAADQNKVGLSNFDSSSFAVAATGFVTLSTTGAGKTITGDSGGALSPTANNWNILGLSGSKTSGSGSTLTVKSPPFSQVGSSATSSLNTGEFVTAAVTRTLPASAGLADGDLFIYVCTTANALVIQAVSAQKIRIGNQISSAAGTATSTAIGDCLTLRFNGTDGFFYAVSVIGNWTLA